jgi:hypothetical protein
MPPRGRHPDLPLALALALPTPIPQMPLIHLDIPILLIINLDLDPGPPTTSLSRLLELAPTKLHHLGLEVLHQLLVEQLEPPQFE